MKNKPAILFTTSFALMIATAIFLHSCVPDKTKCPEVKTEYRYIEQGHKDVVPYKKKDTLSFKHSSGATYIFIGQGIDSAYDFGQASDNDCPGDKYYMEYRKWTFKNMTASGKDIVLTLSYNFGYNSNIISVTGNYQSKVYAVSTTFLAPPPSNYDYDSILINSVTYYYVRKISNKNNYSGPDYLLYNREFGILKIVAGTETLERSP